MTGTSGKSFHTKGRGQESIQGVDEQARHGSKHLS